MTKQVGLLASGNVSRVVLIAIGTLAGTLTATAQNGSVANPSPAYLSALATYDKAWEATDLAFSIAALIDGPSKGFGRYTPRASADYSADEALSVYAEPVGYAFAETAEGYQYHLTASYKLLNTSGQVLAEQDNFAEFTGVGRSKQRELSASLTFQFSGLPVGDYNIEALFSDEIGGKHSSFTLPFTVSGSN